jgi:hypothetical protein
MAHLLKTQSLAQQWEQQRLTSTSIGDINVTTDTQTLGPYYFSNCIIMNIGELSFSGTTVDYGVSIQGTYAINGALFS